MVLGLTPTARLNNPNNKKGVILDNRHFGGIGAHFIDFHPRFFRLFQLRTRGEHYRFVNKKKSVMG